MERNICDFLYESAFRHIYFCTRCKKYSSKLDIFRSFVRIFAEYNKNNNHMIYNERDTRHQQVIEAAKQMMTAARTAPKAKGCDIIEVVLVTE